MPPPPGPGAVTSCRQWAASPVLTESQVAQVEAVGGDSVSGASGQLPPELGAFGVTGKEEQAGEHGGAVLVELAGRAAGRGRRPGG
ncbi:hypothetical protein Shyd_84720 [Streptomyces hydrogenans]|uniref:Uncharacterized protein n=1 Tax=Streptomyces hydrogenans TaxID=1873719 RepID=A0ABQ3PPZ8_9ACTN|nr:hypothetical protein Shyd_84720 [Streptomyces hydrogenans]